MHPPLQRMQLMRQTARMIGRSNPTVSAAARTTPCFGGFGSRARTLVTRAMYEESDQVGNGGGYYEPSQGAASPKAFASFNVYKGKSALQLKLIGPTWKDTSKGGVYVDREGVLFMEFANSNPQQVRHARIFLNPCNMVADVRIIVFLFARVHLRVAHKQPLSSTSSPPREAADTGTARTTGSTSSRSPSRRWSWATFWTSGSRAKALTCSTTLTWGNP